MTLIVEDATGNPDAESYSTVAEASTYVAKWHQSAAWDTASEAEKERALRRGARFVDSHRFLGARTYSNQALDWPRVNVGIVDGQLILSDDLPQRIKDATVEAAIRDVEGVDLLTDTDGGSIRSESKSVGSLQTKTDYAAPKTPGKQFKAIEALLKPFMASGKLVRAIA